MRQEEIITLGNFMYDTAVTIIFMTLFIGGLGMLGIVKALKSKIIYSKDELFNKEENYTPLQMLLAGILFLSISLWYNFYKENIFFYVKKAKIFFTKLQMNVFDFELMEFLPILGVIIIILFFISISFQKDYADKQNEMYTLEFNILNKILGIFVLGIMYIMTDFVNSKGICYQSILISIFTVFVGISTFLYFIKTKILFNEEIIEFHTFWRPKHIINWKDVKKMTYEDTNRQNMILITKDNKKYKISTRLSGLRSFISMYKIRNKKKVKEAKV